MEEHRRELVRAALTRVQGCPSEENASSNGRRPNLLHTIRAAHTSPETLVDLSISDAPTNKIPEGCLVGFVEGSYSTHRPAYWASSGEFLFLLGSVELLLPSLGEVTAASFRYDEKEQGKDIIGMVVSKCCEVTVLRICLAERDVTVVASFSTCGISAVHAIECNGFTDALLVGEISTSVAFVRVSRDGQVQMKWHESPSSLLTRLAFFRKPRCMISAYDSTRKLLTTLDDSKTIRSWGISEGLASLVASGVYNDPIDALSLCPAGPEDTFLFVIINKHGARDVYSPEQPLAKVEPAGASVNNELVFRRQVSAPSGCDVGLLDASYAGGTSVFLFADRFVSSTVAPSFVDPEIGPHEVVDSTVVTGDHLPCLIPSLASASIVAGEHIYTLRRRSDFMIFADMLLDEPLETTGKAVSGLGPHDAAFYIWMMIPTEQAVSAIKELARPVVEGNSVTLTPLISVVVSQLAEIISQFRKEEAACSVFGQSISERLEVLVSKMEICLEKEGWCDSAYADQALLEIDTSAYPTVKIINFAEVSFGLASSVQGLVLSTLLSIVRTSQLVFSVWLKAQEDGLGVPSSSIFFGPYNWCAAEQVRNLCYSILTTDISKGLACLASLPESVFEGISEVKMMLRVLSAALNGSFDDGLDMLGAFASQLLHGDRASLDLLLSHLTPIYHSSEMPLGPEVRTVISKIEYARLHGSSEFANLHLLRSRLEALVASIQDIKEFEVTLLRIVGWLPSDELGEFLRFMESFTVEDVRLPALGRVYRQALVQRARALVSFSPNRNNATARCMVALGYDEPTKTAELIRTIQEQNDLSLDSRFCVLNMCSESNDSVAADQRFLLVVQSRISELHPSTEVRLKLATEYASPSILFALSADVEGEGPVLQASLLRFLSDVDSSLVSSVLACALEAGSPTSSHFCHVVGLLGSAIISQHLPVMAAALIMRDDGPALVEALCTSHEPESVFVEPSFMFYTIDALIHELEGGVMPGVISKMFATAQATKQLIQDTDARNQCGAIIEDRAARLLQAAEFGVIGIASEDRSALQEAAAIAKSELVPNVALYSEGTVAF